MLGIKKALEAFRAYPQDPYIVIPKTNIELRFGDDGSILAAYNADIKPALRWYSDEFIATLKAAGAMLREL